VPAARAPAWLPSPSKPPAHSTEETRARTTKIKLTIYITREILNTSKLYTIKMNNFIGKGPNMIIKLSNIKKSSEKVLKELHGATATKLITRRLTKSLEVTTPNRFTIEDE
jgi:hypothetical protein